MMRNILVVCRTNSMMSPIVQAFLNARAGGSWHAFSAGSQPVGRANPYTSAILKDAGIALDPRFLPLDWHRFAGADAPRFEIVLTVSEDVAWEDMPAWNGVPRLMHWALPDPLAMSYSASERLSLIGAWRDLARARVDAFLAEEGQALRIGTSANDNRKGRMRALGA
jgi:arsenate reductase